MRLQIEILMVALCLLIGSAAGWYVEHLKFIAYETAVKAEGEKQQIKSEQTAKLQTVITKDTSKDYEAKIAAIKRAYDDRLRNNSSSSQVSVISCTASGADAKASDALPVAEVSKLPEQCAETTQQLETLQDWITKQQLVNQ